MNSAAIGSNIVCVACGAGEFNVLLDEQKHHYQAGDETRTWTYRLLECQKCGLGFIDPKPTWDLIQTFYDEEYGSYDNSGCDPASEAKSLKYRIAKLRMAGMRRRGISGKARTGLGVLAEWATGRTVSCALGVPLQLDQDAAIFEIGYGSGNWLLTMARLGFRNLHGYDLSVNAGNAARLTGSGIKVSSGDFLENAYSTEAFDCIRLEHVFEHLLTPLDVLKKCHTMLKPGGYLVMSFPCKDSWSMKLSLVHSPALQLPKHLYHHTPASATLMLETAGFVPLRVHAYSVAAQFGGTVNGMRGKNRRIPPLFFEILGPLYHLWGEVTRKGDFLTVWAQKRKAN